MKILFLGEIGHGQTSLMRMRALIRLGHEVAGVNTVKPWQSASWLQRQVQRRLQRGSIVNEINQSVIDTARELRPDLVWAEKQEYLRPETLRTAKKLGARLIHFTPDPYFSLEWKRTHLMDEAFGHFDVLVYCKSYEKSAYEALDRPLVYMPLGYCDEVHRPIVANGGEWRCEVGFLGGWDPYRERAMSRLARAGIDLKIRGGYWDFLADGRWSLRRHLILRQLAGSDQFSIHQDKALADCLQGDEVYGDDYARALTGAKIGLGFLRRVWPDQHTTRTFEIPACGSMLLADRTEEHQEFFAEGSEAEYFSSEDELLDKAGFYTANETARQRIAEAGRERCEKSQYAYIHRLSAALKQIQGLQ